MHWRALSAIWLLLWLVPALVTAQGDATSTPTVIITSITDERKAAAGDATTSFVQATPVLAAATADDDDESDGVGSPTIISASSSQAASASSSASVTVHKPQIISTAVGGAHPPSGVITHTRTNSAGNSTHTFVFSLRPQHTQTFRPRPTITSPSADSNDDSSSGAHIHQSTVAIVAEVLGGVAALLVCLCCTRCVVVYRRTPKRDRIAAVVDRHLLERELAAMEEARPRMFRGEVFVPPPPPYQPAPHYEEVVGSEPSSAHSRTDSEGSEESAPGEGEALRPRLDSDVGRHRPP